MSLFFDHRSGTGTRSLTESALRRSSICLPERIRLAGVRNGSLMVTITILPEDGDHAVLTILAVFIWFS